MKKIFELFVSLISKNDAVSTKRVAFLLGTLSSIIWLSIDLHNGMTSGWLMAYQTFIGAVVISYVGGSVVESNGKKKETDE